MPFSNVSLLSPQDPRIPGLLAALERRPAESFFLSHWWISACAETWPSTAGHGLLVLDCHGDGQAGNERQAIALLGARNIWRHGWLRVRILGLNQSLDEDLDEPTMELNGLYGVLGPEFPGLFESLLEWLGKRHDWDEFMVPGVFGERAQQIRTSALKHGLRLRVAKQSESWWVDLEEISSKHGGDYLAALSANTRQQLRRSRRAIEKEYGALSIEQAGSAEEALTWIDELAALHRTRWAVPGARSGFDIPTFRAFHRTLITNAFAAGGIQMLRISAGESTIAWIYNLVLNGHVHFIMSGIDLERFHKFQPGLLAHQLAIEHNLAAGARIYDFLAGTARYKANLGTHRSTQEWLVLWRPRPGLLLEDRLRKIKWWFKNARGKSSPADQTIISERDR